MLTREIVAMAIATGGPTKREVETAPAFKVGDTVATLPNASPQHTRLPRYARGRMATVIRYQGAHVFPDSHSQGLGEAPQHVYSLRFAAVDLWGKTADPAAFVYLDVWESQLEPVS